MLLNTVCPPDYIIWTGTMTDKHDPSTQVSADPDFEEHMSIGRYIMTRIPTLVPPMRPAPNPFKALTLLNRQQWLFFAVCILFLYSYLHSIESVYLYIEPRLLLQRKQ